MFAGSVMTCNLCMCLLLHGCSEQKSTAGSTKKPSGNSVKVGGKKGSRKDEEWEEVSRKCVPSLSHLYLICI